MRSLPPFVPRKLLNVAIPLLLALARPAAAAALDAVPRVDVPMLLRGPEPAIEVMVNGRGPFLFAIDTGATDDARIDSSLIEQLGLRVSGTDMVGDSSSAARIKVGTLRVDSIAVGPLVFRHVKASTRDFNTIAGLPHIDGLLTFDLFRDFLLTLDYPAARVRIERGELPAVDGARILRLKRVHGHPAVDIMIGGKRVTPELDSGNVGGGFLFPGALAASLPLETAPVDAGRARTVTNAVDVKTAQLHDDIHLGSFIFPKPQITFPAPFPFANIGSRILNQFAVTFDQKHDRVRFIQEP